jgi:hypothetical protein
MPMIHSPMKIHWVYTARSQFSGSVCADNPISKVYTVCPRRMSTYCLDDLESNGGGKLTECEAKTVQCEKRSSDLGGSDLRDVLRM